MSTAEVVLHLTPKREPHERVRLYVWDAVVRWTHWLIAGSIATLAVTGLFIGHPFAVSPRTQAFLMGTVRIVHFYAAIVFSCAVAVRLAWLFIGSPPARWDRMLPVTRDRWRGMLGTLKYYLVALRKPPTYAGHNPLAGASYTVIFLVYLTMIVTGAAMYGAMAPLGSLMHLFAPLGQLLGGLASVRWLHHTLMWALIAFVIFHVYSSVLTSAIEKNGTVDSIFSGYKTVDPTELMHPEVWFDQVAKKEEGTGRAH